MQVVSTQQIKRKIHESAKCFIVFACTVNDNKTKKIWL